MVRAFQFTAALLLGIDVVLVSTQVILRYVFNNPQAWAEEVGRYVFVWVIFIGALLATARDSHIRVTVLTERFGSAGVRFSRALSWLLAVPTFSYVAYLGYQLAWRNRFTTFYTIEGAPRVVFFLAVPVGFTLMVLVLLYLWRTMLRSPDALDATVVPAVTPEAP